MEQPLKEAHRKLVAEQQAQVTNCIIANPAIMYFILIYLKNNPVLGQSKTGI